ncbi:hypothetical protein DFQ12_2161 [Sphingobacterium detergens]|uniref:Uncharacterized protein n=1 Tax=Sphingobacterium detergens TaxID=1145106 RepID=A0A420BL17_SPHD1|nr:hypothetical protein DFQ12_2161 [Sphingobacterium detergens]
MTKEKILFSNEAFLITNVIYQLRLQDFQS